MKKTIRFLLATCLVFSCFIANISSAKAYDNNMDVENLYLDGENYLVASLDDEGVECYVNPRGATDEYYYLESYRRYGNEFVLKTERYSQYYQAGITLIGLANVSNIFWTPVNSAVLNAAFYAVTNFIPSVSRNYNTVVTHYATYGEATYRIEVGGQFSRYATYTNLKVPSRKVYNYS